MKIFLRDNIWMPQSVLVLGVFLFHIATATAAPPLDMSEVAFRMAKYTFKAPSEYNREPLTVELAYPIFLGGNPASTNRLNGWLRRVAFTTFFMGDDTRLSRALKQSDLKVIDGFTNQDGTADMTKSVLRPESASGDVLTFILHAESMGTARSHEGITVYSFDIRTGRQIATESLFKSGAEESLKDYFLKDVRKEFPKCKDIDFSWDRVAVSGPTRASLHLSNNSAQRECGDLGYLNGEQVRAQLKSPAALLPIRTLREVP